MRARRRAQGEVRCGVEVSPSPDHADHGDGSGPAAFALFPFAHPAAGQLHHRNDRQPFSAPMPSSVLLLKRRRRRAAQHTQHLNRRPCPARPRIRSHRPSLGSTHARRRPRAGPGISQAWRAHTRRAASARAPAHRGGERKRRYQRMHRRRERRAGTDFGGPVAEKRARARPGQATCVHFVALRDGALVTPDPAAAADTSGPPASGRGHVPSLCHTASG